MPKTKTKTVWAKKTRRKLQNGIAHSQNSEQVYQKEDITHVVRQLDSTLESDRASAANTIALLIRNESARKLLLRERAVLKLAQLGTHGFSPEALAAYYGALRAIALHEGYDSVLFMFRQDILTPLQKLLINLLQPSGIPSSSYIELTDSQSLLLENILYLLKALSETNEKVIFAIHKAQISSICLDLTGFGSMSQDVEIANLQFLYSFTEDNLVGCGLLANNKTQWTTLCNAVKSPRTPLAQILAAGALHNVLECNVLEFEVLPVHLSKLDAFVLQHVNPRLCDASLSLDGRYTLLELIASVASTIAMQYMVDDDDNANDPGDNDNMDLIFDEEKNLLRAAAKDLGPLLGNAFLKTQALFTMQSDVGLQIRIVDCLNNILWTLHALKATQYINKAELWQWCFNAVRDSKMKDLACHFSSLMLGVAVLSTPIDFTAQEIELLIRMYDEVDADSQGKIMALLGNIGQTCALEVNDKIGQFLIFHISTIPTTATSPAVEAMDAVIDLYADETKESNAVFVNNSFLPILEDALPKALHMAKSIDKRKKSDLRARADDVCSNMINFCKYKSSL